MANFERELDFRSLPNGEWILFGSMPDDTTPENFAEWLQQFGFNVIKERIAVKQCGPRCSVIVSFPHSDFARLVNGAIYDQKFHKLSVIAQPYCKADRETLLDQ